MTDTEILSENDITELLSLPEGCARAMVDTGRWPAIHYHTGQIVFRKEFAEGLVKRMQEKEQPTHRAKVRYVGPKGTEVNATVIEMNEPPRLATIRLDEACDGIEAGGTLACVQRCDQNTLGTWHFAK